MLAASAMYVMGEDDPKARQQAESIILAGVRREERMWLRGRGFKMYPDGPNQPDTYYGPKAARYLHYLDLLRNTNGGGPTRSLLDGIDKTMEMARNTAAAYRLDWPPTDPSNCEEAYATVRFGADPTAHNRALDVARRHAQQSGASSAASEFAGGAVGLRAESAYGAATLSLGGSPSDLPTVLALANEVVQHLGENGRLYSTVDSVAAIALMSQLRAAGIVGTRCRVLVDGCELSTDDALSVEGAQSIEALEGTITVEVERLMEEDWEKYAGGVPLQIRLQADRQAKTRFRAGDYLDLVVTLPKGYRSGDLLGVCLPDALSRIIGGGQLKRFAIDFEGRNELRVPLAATSTTVSPDGSPGPARFAVCACNMFEEERAGSPGLIEVTVLPVEHRD
jgi:hypothetical protein